MGSNGASKRLEGEMIVLVEKPQAKETPQGEKYWTFSVNFIENGITVAGWKYFPARGTVGTPSISKGPGKGFIRLVTVTKDLYNLILEKVQETLR